MYNAIYQILIINGMVLNYFNMYLFFFICFYFLNFPVSFFIIYRSGLNTSACIVFDHVLYLKIPYLNPSILSPKAKNNI